MPCNGCGDCCENIWLNVTKAEIDDTNLSGRFIKQHWHSAGRRQGEGNRHRWTCDQFDPATRQCTAYEERPPVCSGYPWYNTPTLDRLVTLPERCSYRDEWHPVDLIRKAA